MATWCSGDSALDQQQVAFDVNTNDLKTLRRDTLCTHMASHLLALEHPSGGLH